MTSEKYLLKALAVGLWIVYKAVMAKIASRVWSADTAIAQAVEFVGGLQWAAAITGMTPEGLKLALLRGSLQHGPAAVRLARECLARGNRFSIESLVGEAEIGGSSDPSPRRKGGRMKNAKGGILHSIPSAASGASCEAHHQRRKREVDVRLGADVGHAA